MGTVPLPESQRGYLLITVVVALFLLATVAVLLSHDSAISANTSSTELEAARAEYVAQAGMQHAIWRTRNNACMGDVTIPATPIGNDSYSATITGADSGTAYVLTADQDAWIRSDNPTNNEGTSSTNHIRQETGLVEQVLTRFNLAALPANAQINSAVVRFYLKAGKEHPEGPVTLHEITADWGETTVTWESFAVAYRSAPVGTIPPQATGGIWVEVNLTGLVQAWVNGQPNHGILMQTASEGIHTEYSAREDGANAPQLTVVVGSGQASPVTINATSKLDTGVQRKLKDKITLAYQPPATVVLQLGVDPGEDAMPDSFYSARNYGGATYVQVNDNGTDWQQYPLIRFDLGKVPRGAAVRSAQLELHMRNINSPGTATIHQVTRSWVEGTKSGGGTADGATWFTYDGTNAWALAGGDFNPAVVAETAIDGSETWVNWDVAPLVQRWLAGDPNYGLMIRPANGLRQAEFSSKEDSGVGVQPKLTIEYACECGNACMAPQGSGNILMVVRDATNMWYYDRQKKAIFESWGYTVNVIDDAADVSDFDAGIAANDVAYISEPVTTSEIGTKLSDAAIGVVSDEGRMNGELGIASDYATPVLGKAINVSDTSHYITRVFQAGSLEIYSDAMEGLTVAGNVSPDSQTLADWGGAGSLVVLDAGMQKESGGSVAGRRVMLPFGRQVDSNVNWDYINGNGRLIVQRAIEWGMDANAAPAGLNVLLVVGNATSPASKDTGRQALMESWGYTVTLIDDGDSQANFDAAAAANDVVYVSGTIGGGALADKLSGSPTPIVNEFPGKLDNFGFSSVTTDTFTADRFTSSDASHYITEPFGGGSVNLLTGFMTMSVVNGTLAPDLQMLGEFGVGEVGLVTLDAGGMRWDGQPAPARRAHLPFAPAETTQLTTDGETIMRRALEWGAAAGGGSLGPIAHWKLDETSGLTAVDSEGGHDGTLIMGQTWGVGRIDGGLDFDGVDDIINVGAPAALDDVFSGGGTVTAWIYPRGPGANNSGRVVDKWNSNTNGWLFSLYGESLLVQRGFSGAVGTWHSAAGSIQMDTWQHVAVVYDDSSDANVPVLYIDGIPQALTEMFAPSGTSGSDAGIDLNIGDRSVGSTPRTFDGILDDVRVYDTMLSASEIADLAGAGSSQQEILLVVADATNLSAQDIARQTLMADWDYQVATISASDSQANFDAAVATASAAYVVMQNSSTALGTKLRDATIAVINEEVELRAEIGFAANRDWPTTRDTVDIIVDSHYITSPFSPGLLTIATAPIEVVTLSGQMAGGLLVLGQQDWGGLQNSLSVIDTGGALYGGGNAAGRRVQLPWGRVGFDINNLNADGLTIMRRAIEWGIAGGGGGGGGGSGTTVTLFPTKDTFVGGNSTAVYGGNTSLFMGFGSREWRPVLQFDASGIPAGSTVTSAKLRLHNWDDGSASAGPLTVTAYGVEQAWTETWGNKGANWYDRAKQGGGALQWSTPGVSYSTGDSAIATFDSTAAPQWVEWEVAPLVQGWIDGASTNNGIVLVPDAGGAWANSHSADYGDAALHPQLVVTYE